MCVTRSAFTEVFEETGGFGGGLCRVMFGGLSGLGSFGEDVDGFSCWRARLSLGNVGARADGGHGGDGRVTIEAGWSLGGIDGAIRIGDLYSTIRDIMHMQPPPPRTLCIGTPSCQELHVVDPVLRIFEYTPHSL